MSRKTLLTETQVRQFLKLANLSHVGDQRLAEMGALSQLMGGRDEEDELEDELHATEDELGAEDSLADEEGAELDDLEGDLGAPEGGGETVSVDDFMSALETALEDVLGEPTTVDMDAGEEEVETDLDVELGPEGGEELELGAEEEEELPLEETGAGRTGASAGDDSATHPGEKDYTTKKGDKLKRGSGKRGSKPGDEAYVNEDAIVAEVARRVAARLSATKKKESLADQLAERIFNRITAK